MDMTEAAERGIDQGIAQDNQETQVVTVVLLDPLENTPAAFEAQMLELEQSGPFHRINSADGSEGWMSFDVFTDKIGAFINRCHTLLSVPHVVRIGTTDHDLYRDRYRLLRDDDSIGEAQKIIDEIFDEVPRGVGAATNI